MSSPCIVMPPPTPTYHNFESHSPAGNSPGSVNGLTALTSCVSSTSDPSSNGYSSANEIMRGHVTLLSSSHGPQRVILSVFRTSVDHFALVYPDNRRKTMVLKPAGCINIRGVTCEETTLGSGIKGFTLRPKKCDTSSAALIFVCQDSTTMPKWLAALESATSQLGKRKIPRQCSLPIVSEEEE
ncbi:unnamed protein product [Allacma fusca]|uniref:PH domain-containing protein n=1 Tax=Allacma fusca TaxID=39272 RepID=A0A8J2LJW2_9HEXA|nr:unnamed protein product [Allacma fusca]